MYSHGFVIDDDKSLTLSDIEDTGMYSPEELVKLKDPNECTDEQQGVTQGNKDLVDRKIECKPKREESLAGNTCKKSKVGYPHIPVGDRKISV